MMNLSTLYRIVAPHFVAGVLVDEDSVVEETAPILRWAMGRELGWLVSYCTRKRWQLQFVPRQR